MKRLHGGHINLNITEDVASSHNIITMFTDTLNKYYMSTETLNNHVTDTLNNDVADTKTAMLLAHRHSK